MMHRDEAIYARSDARGGITLTAEEAALALPYIERAIETYPWEDDAPLRALAARLETACGLPPYEDAPPEANWWDDRTDTEEPPE